jgi:hypothetical protein
MGVDVGALRHVRTVPSALRSVEFDAFSVSLGLGVIAGGLALLAPYLNSLALALVTLAGAGWSAGLPRGEFGWRNRLPRARSGSLVLLGLGSVLFIVLPPPWNVARGLALALSFVPMWFVERRPGLPHGVRPGLIP